MNAPFDRTHSLHGSWRRVALWLLMFLSAIGFVLGLALHLALLLRFTDSPVDWMFVHGGLLVVWPLLVGIGIYRGWKRGGDYAPAYPKWMQVLILCLFVYSGSYLISVLYVVYRSVTQGGPDPPGITDTLVALCMTSFPLIFHAAAFMFFYTILYRKGGKEEEHWSASG